MTPVLVLALSDQLSRGAIYHNRKTREETDTAREIYFILTKVETF